VSTKKHTSETGHEIGIEAARRPFQVGLDAEKVVASDDEIAHWRQVSFTKAECEQ
jgi:hypothetical protein